MSRLSAFLDASRTSIYQWRRRFLAHGGRGLEVREGRGRKAVANPQQIEGVVCQSPRDFGLAQTRWTLQGLAQVVPSLKGFSPFGVQKALARLGLRHKRGQPWQHSPDPQYAQKKGLSTKRWKKSGLPGSAR